MIEYLNISSHSKLYSHILPKTDLKEPVEVRMNFFLVAILSVVRSQNSQAIARLGSESSDRQGGTRNAMGTRISPFHFFMFLLVESLFGRFGAYSPNYFQEKRSEAGSDEQSALEQALNPTLSST